MYVRSGFISVMLIVLGLVRIGVQRYYLIFVSLLIPQKEMKVSFLNCVGFFREISRCPMLIVGGSDSSDSCWKLVTLNSSFTRFWTRIWAEHYQTAHSARTASQTLLGRQQRSQQLRDGLCTATDSVSIQYATHYAIVPTNSRSLSV